MEGEGNLGDLFDQIADQVALARSKALMGEREQALGIFHGASLEFVRLQEVLRDYPGYHALEHAFNVTMNALDTESAAAPEPVEHVGRAAGRGTRRRTRRAA